jgi:hypothetical protein
MPLGPFPLPDCDTPPRPAREPAHREASAGPGDLIGPLVKRLGEIGQARSPIEQRQQHAQLSGGKAASLEQFQYAIERGLRNGRGRSIAGACSHDVGWLGMRHARSGPADVMANHAPIVDARRGEGNGCQRASCPRPVPAYTPASDARGHWSERTTGSPLAVAIRAFFVSMQWSRSW